MHSSNIKGWRIPRAWPGETAYVVGGGPSLRNVDLACLKGRRVIVVNSSYQLVPFADYLFFGDQRWWLEHDWRPEMQNFRGQIVTCSTSVSHLRVHKVNRRLPPEIGLAVENDAVVSQRTSTQGAMNLAFHLGVKRIVLVGIDMGRAPDGASHHHKPHPWPPRPGNVVWDEQLEQLQHIVGPLKRHGVEVINTSPVSRIEWWPKMSLQAALESDNVGRKHAS
jgi:hypothetical protein